MHASYPYLFEAGTRVYCAPEVARKREVRVYELDVMTGELSDAASVLRDFDAVDPTFVQHEGRWWMFCSKGDSLPQAALYVWHAPDLLGPWQPHAANPVKVDVCGARPAGTPFFHEGRLYRPAQDCSRGYGSGFVIYRIERLTPTEFAEVEVARFGSLAKECPEGSHTLAAAGSFTVVDGKRRAFAPLLVQQRLAHKLRRLRGAA